MFKTHNGFSQISFLDIFHKYNKNNFYSLRSQIDFHIPRINTALKAVESVRYFGPVTIFLSIIMPLLKTKSSK